MGELKVSTVLWLAADPKQDVVQAFEGVTQLKVVVTDGQNTNWNGIENRFRAVLIELPAADAVIRAALAQSLHTTVPLPVVIYDKESVLDESLLRPPAIFHHLTGPRTPQELGAVVCGAPRAGTKKEPWADLLIGESQPMKDLHALIRLIGPRQTTVLISGETGTGKEMVARALHRASHACRIRNGGGQLRGYSRESGGSGIVRTCEGRLHRSGECPHGLL